MTTSHCERGKMQIVLCVYFSNICCCFFVVEQRDMARLLHWGSQGIQRNLQAAAEYYRQGAQGDDPQGNYDYGIVLLRVGH